MRAGVLHRLQLRTVVAVVPTAPTAPWAAWCADNGVRLIHIHCEIYKEKNPVNNTIASRVLEVGRDLAPAEFYDRLVTLTTGSYRIGRCLRRSCSSTPRRTLSFCIA